MADLQIATQAERAVRPEAVDTICEHLDVYAALDAAQQFTRRRETAARMVAAILALTKEPS